jgi:hypothetical protein
MGQRERTSKPGRQEVWQRSRYSVNGHGFSYALDINMVMLAGVVCRRPSVAVMGQQRFTWCKLRHVDQGHRKRGCVMNLRFGGALAEWAHANLDLDDHICVVGRIWMGETGKVGNRRQFFNWIQVETASTSMPVQLTADRNFVRVRSDLWNRLCMLAGDAGVELRVPETARKTVKWGDVNPYHHDPEVESPADIETLNTDQEDEVTD